MATKSKSPRKPDVLKVGPQESLIVLRHEKLSFCKFQLLKHRAYRSTPTARMSREASREQGSASVHGAAA